MAYQKQIMSLEKVGTFILTTESLDRHSERVLTKGVNIKSFRKNSVMLYNHQRGDMLKGASLPIGVWRNIKRNDGNITADAFIDFDDEFAAAVGRKIKNGVLSAVSIGFKALAFSDDPKDKVKGQLGYTITKSELLEASIVDIPANPQAVATSIQKYVSSDQSKGIEANTPKEIQETILYKSINGRTEVGESEPKNISMEFLNTIKSEVERLWGKAFGENASEQEVTDFLAEQVSIKEINDKVKTLETSNADLLEKVTAATQAATETKTEMNEKGQNLAVKVDAKLKTLDAKITEFEAANEKLTETQKSVDAKLAELTEGLKSVATEANKAKLKTKATEKGKEETGVKEEIKSFEAGDNQVIMSKEAVQALWG